ncbi:contractile injection system tape measure protein [Corallococcus aberystwythensis]|nr:contractile injection system tape measure protein [Corallococcus aberystwythensis]
MGHLIHRQIVELELHGGGEPFSMQSEVSRVCREELPLILERVFDELVPGAAHLRWERLVLDLGALRGLDVETLATRLREALREVLRRARTSVPAATPGGTGATASGARDAGLEELSPEASDEELLRVFLETGMVPWWAEGLDGAELNARLLALLKRPSGGVAPWLRGHDGAVRMAQRVLGQLPASTALTLLEVLAREEGVEAVLATVLGTAPPGVPVLSWRRLLVETLLPVALASRPGSLHADAVLEVAQRTAVAQGSDPRTVRAPWRQQVPSALALAAPARASEAPREADPAGESLVAEALPPPKESPAAREERASSPPGAPARAAGHAAPHREVLLPQASVHEEPRPPVTFQPPRVERGQQAHWMERPHPTEAVARGVEATPGPPETSSELRAPPPLPGTRPLPPAGPRAGSVPRAPSVRPDPTALPRAHAGLAAEALLQQGLPVDNAGLVLLHPFLKTFFDAVGLLEGKVFRDFEAQCRAVCLSQWLVHEDGAEDEHRMPLSKVLCGIPLEEVVPRLGGPTEAERAEGEALLQHVVSQWTVLKNTSTRGLRDAFLQRKGLLRRDERGWVLRLEAKPYDMLLERLPWGISHIRLSWMRGLLQVER